MKYFFFFSLHLCTPCGCSFSLWYLVPVCTLSFPHCHRRLSCKLQASMSKREVHCSYHHLWLFFLVLFSLQSYLDVTFFLITTSLLWSSISQKEITVPVMCPNERTLSFCMTSLISSCHGKYSASERVFFSIHLHEFRIGCLGHVCILLVLLPILESPS